MLIGIGNFKIFGKIDILEIHCGVPLGRITGVVIAVIDEIAILMIYNFVITFPSKNFFWTIL